MPGESEEQGRRGKEEAALHDIDAKLGNEGILDRYQTGPIDVAC